VSYLNKNIKHLRKLKGFTQSDLAERIGLKRAQIGSYEEHRAEPKIDAIQKIAYLFGLSLESLINQDLTKSDLEAQVDIEGRTLRILPIVVDLDNQEQISVVPVAARAGYTHGYADPEYIKDLPKFNLPLPELYPDKSYRLFQIEGDSMLPIPEGSYIICEYVEDWRQIKEGMSHIIVTKSQGIVYKRVWRDRDSPRLLLKSDNVLYDPYYLEIQDLVEVWKSLAYLSFRLPDQQDNSRSDMQQLSHLFLQLKKDVDALKA
jgi:transcriptional regulator with XRE-family HTH domain